MSEHDEEHCHQGYRVGRWGGGHGEHHGHRHGEECGCGGRGEHHRRFGHGGECGCGGPGMGFRRRFQTREEQIARLEEYLHELQAEAKAVEERIAELRA